MFDKKTVDYDPRKKVFWVKVNSGQRYEKPDIDSLTRELSSLGVKWKLTRRAVKQLGEFKTDK